MPGTVKQFVDFTNNTNSDTGANTAASILPIVDGETVSQGVLQRPDESLRQRTEAIRNVQADSLYLRDADRSLIVGGPGLITWPGSTTAAATGIPVLSNTLWVIPMLTPGYAQTAPIPPVASAFGVIHLKRADSLNSIAVSSLRRSYASGDQINVTVTAGAVFSCLLAAGTGYRRTINIVATPSTTLATTITALNALIPTAPDNTQLVGAVLEGGALGTDLLLTTQATQYMSGNFDGEGHALTPANLAAFFTANPASALAEGDTLCIEYTMVSDTATTGGRRQAVPENSNTAVPVGSYFNSRVSPAKLVNAIPICKVVNNDLIFDTGAVITAGAVTAPLSGVSTASVVPYAGGPAWADGTTNPATTVENQLDKIVADLAGATGTAKIQGTLIGSELAVGTLAAQIAAIVKRSLGWITIGNGTTIVGDFNTPDYANANLLLTAAIAALPSNGGTILLKKGTPLAGFAGATIALPAGKTVEIRGDHARTPSTTPHLTFTASEGLVCSAAGKLILRDLHIRHAATAVTLTTAPCEVYGVYMENTATTDAGAAFQGVNVNDLTLNDVYSTTVLTTVAPNAMIVRITGIGRRLYFRRMRHFVNTATFKNCGGITIVDMRQDVVFDEVIYESTTAQPSGAGNFITINTTDNTTEISNRRISNVIGMLGDSSACVRNDSVGHIDLINIQNRYVGNPSYLLTSSGYSGTGPVRIRQCKEDFQTSGSLLLGNYPDLAIESCDFRGTALTVGGVGTATLGDIVIRFNRFVGQASGNLYGVSGLSADHIEFTGNRWNIVKGPVPTDSTTGFCVQITCTTDIENVRIINNTVEDFFNIVYGTANTFWPNVFAVRANHVAVVQVIDNQVVYLGKYSSGAAHRAPNFLCLTSANGTTNASANWGSIVVENNVVGDPDSFVTLISLNLIVPNTLKICGNHVTSRWSSTVGIALVHDWILLSFGNSSAVIDVVSITDNDFNIFNSSNTQITKDLVSYTSVLTAFAKCVAIQQNHLAMSAGAVDFAIGMSFAILVGGIVSFALQGNLFERNVATPSIWFRTSFSNNPTGTLPAGGPPATTVAWTDNRTIHSL